MARRAVSSAAERLDHTARAQETAQQLLVFADIAVPGEHGGVEQRQPSRGKRGRRPRGLASIRPLGNQDLDRPPRIVVRLTEI